MQRRSLLRAAGVAASGVVLAAACSSGGNHAQSQGAQINARPNAASVAPSANAPDACKLVTEGDASTLFGHAANVGGRTAAGVCIWNAGAALAGGDQVRFTLVTHAYDGDSAYSEPRVPGGRRVTALGEHTFTYSVANTATIEFVAHNKTVVMIYSIRSANGQDAPKITAEVTKLIAAARAAAARV